MVLSPNTVESTSQTTPDLTINTPRKKKLRNSIKRKNNKIYRMKMQLKPKKIKKSESTLKEELAQLPENVANFIREQIKLHSKKSHGRRYSPELKTMALSLYHASGKAYRLLSKIFVLPNKASLKRYISKLPTVAGISEAILKAIQQKVQHMNEMEKICSLCIDEISLKNHLYYNVPDDIITGLEDFGIGVRSNKIATSTLVLLIRSISGNWKQPIGYALVNGSCPTDFLDGLIRKAIEKLDAIGLRVLVVMSDMGSNFYSLALHLGITPEKPWFTHKNKIYFLMFDPPHLIKCIRTNLMKYTFKFGKLVASWKDIEAFYNKDKSLQIRSAHKLTNKHIHPNNFNKMKVKYATQVLSNTVAASLCTYISLGVLPQTAMGTAHLILKFDSLFDSVNSSKLYSPKQIKKPITETSNHVNFVKDMIDFIKSLQVFQGNTDVTVSNRSNNAALVRPGRQPQTLVLGETDYREKEVSSSIVQQNAVAYVAGYLLKKCFTVHKCSLCKDATMSQTADSANLLYCYYKNYNESTQSQGLILPSQHFLDFVLHLEDVFVQQFSAYNRSKLVGANLLKSLQSVSITFHSCPEFPMDYMLKLFLRMHIYYTIKFENRRLATPTKKGRKSRKYIKVSHL
ncbi:Transposable element P transposase [Paramuricea clavata]|nr:Transposable element P transposase [Paramuricea clavata]